MSARRFLGIVVVGPSEDPFVLHQRPGEAIDHQVRLARGGGRIGCCRILTGDRRRFRRTRRELVWMSRPVLGSLEPSRDGILSSSEPVHEEPAVLRGSCSAPSPVHGAQTVSSSPEKWPGPLSKLPLFGQGRQLRTRRRRAPTAPPCAHQSRSSERIDGHPHQNVWCRTPCRVLPTARGPVAPACPTRQIHARDHRLSRHRMSLEKGLASSQSPPVEPGAVSGSPSASMWPREVTMRRCAVGHRSAASD